MGSLRSEAQVVRLGGVTRSPVAEVAAGKPAGVRRKCSVNRYASTPVAASVTMITARSPGWWCRKIITTCSSAASPISNSTSPR